MAEKEDSSKIKLLANGLTEHLVAGEKLIQLVRLEGKDRNVLQNWIRTKRRHSNALTDAFPGVAPKSAVVTFRDQPVTSVGSVDLEVGAAALFTASRNYVETVDVPPSRLKAGAAEGFEKLVGYQRVYMQTYEAVWLPPQGDYACIAVDLPRGIPKSFAQASADALHHAVRQQLGHQLKLLNFWPAVYGLYLASDGKLVDYGFSVAGQSVNHHKARRRSECLRKAVYDAAGAKAVAAAGDELELFKVAMQWQLKQTDGVLVEPEVLVPGVAADLNKAMPIVNHVILRDCLTTRDLEFVVSKLAPHVK
ncbi:hypothetical protein GCM10027191_24230 [Novilysobacter erysipheiresistens]